ncbi:MAG: hypothetical protein JOY68_00505 [Candidatus Dormibacteraeota bacterium]|nr:hypothetical protein [Candidatus Dormibacteraeota bacterium]
MNRRVALALLALPTAALAAVWHALPAASPPLYDGVCLSDPYRLLGHTPAPNAASHVFGPVSDDNFMPSELTSDGTLMVGDPRYENPPQADVLLTTGTLVSPTEPFTLSITPVPSPATLPAGWTLDGNVYRVGAVTSSGVQLQPQSKDPATVLLRATASNPPKTLFVLYGGTWTRLQTVNAGCGDTFEGVSKTFGDFALFDQRAGGPAPPSGGGAPVIPIVVALAVVVALTFGGLLYLNRTPGR